MRIPDFIVIGGMRCGTTTLYHLLQQCGGVFVPPVKELHFFDRRNPELGRCVARYAQTFEPARDGQRCGEITPDYLTTPGCAARMHEAVPEARLVVILRDPVQRAWSHFQFSRLHGVETLPLAEALAAEPRRLADGSDRSDIFFSYLQRSRYLEHLQRFERLFGRDAILVLFLEELTCDAAGHGRRLLRHLGLSPALAPARPRLAASNELSDLYWHNAGAGIARPRALLYRLGRHLEGRTSPARTRDVVSVRRQAGRRLQRLALPLPHPAAEDRHRLAASLAQHDEALARWLGRPPPWQQR